VVQFEFSWIACGFIPDVGTAAATHFEHPRSWIAGSLSCKRFELSVAVGRLERFQRLI
jgi:hypothetical protein